MNEIGIWIQIVLPYTKIISPYERFEILITIMAMEIPGCSTEKKKTEMIPTIVKISVFPHTQHPYRITAP